MAKQVLLASYVALGGTDYSDHISKAELKIQAEDKETTTFGSSGWKEVLAGIKSAELSLTFKQDVAASNVDSVFSALALAGSTTTFEVRLSNAVVGVSNPKYTGTVLVNSWSPISGSVGDVAEVDVSWPTTGAVTRATS
jgi:Phage tail tube protein